MSTNIMAACTMHRSYNGACHACQDAYMDAWFEAEPIGTKNVDNSFPIDPALLGLPASSILMEPASNNLFLNSSGGFNHGTSVQQFPQLEPLFQEPASNNVFLDSSAAFQFDFGNGNSFPQLPQVGAPSEPLFTENYEIDGFSLGGNPQLTALPSIAPRAGLYSAVDILKGRAWVQSQKPYLVRLQESQRRPLPFNFQRSDCEDDYYPEMLALDTPSANANRCWKGKEPVPVRQNVLNPATKVIYQDALRAGSERKALGDSKATTLPFNFQAASRSGENFYPEMLASDTPVLNVQGKLVNKYLTGKPVRQEIPATKTKARHNVPAPTTKAGYKRKAPVDRDQSEGEQEYVPPSKVRRMSDHIAAERARFGVPKKAIDSFKASRSFRPLRPRPQPTAQVETVEHWAPTRPTRPTITVAPPQPAQAPAPNVNGLHDGRKLVNQYREARRMSDLIAEERARLGVSKEAIDYFKAAQSSRPQPTAQVEAVEHQTPNARTTTVQRAQPPQPAPTSEPTETTEPFEYEWPSTTPPLYTPSPISSGFSEDYGCQPEPFPSEEFSGPSPFENEDKFADLFTRTRRAKSSAPSSVSPTSQSRTLRPRTRVSPNVTPLRRSTRISGAGLEKRKASGKSEGGKRNKVRYV